MSWGKCQKVTRAPAKKAKKNDDMLMDGWIGWIADTIEADLRPAGTHFRTAKIRRTLQEAEKMGPISSTQIPLRRSYTFKEHLRLYFNLNRIKVCAFGANINRDFSRFSEERPLPHVVHFEAVTLLSRRCALSER